jgi:CRISPR/Cas system-associated exonuclease Cas4 (RecB family)
MPTKPLKARRIHAWSFSRLSKYELCPASAAYAYVDKLPDPIGPAGQRGSRIDQEASDYALGKLTARPASLDNFAAEFDALRVIGSRGLQVQLELAFTETWAPTTWFGRDAWCRVKMDLAWRDPDDLGRLVVVDNKTGKVREEHKAQLRLYALAALLRYDDVREVDPRLWYLDQGEVHPAAEDRSEVVTRADVPRLKRYWETRVKRLLADTKFKATPGWQCRGCPFARSRGGPCPEA